MPKEIEKINREILTGLLPEIAYRIHISKSDAEYLQVIKESLTDNPEYSVVVYFNHISYNDPLLAAYIARKIDPKYTRHLIAPASYSHTDPDNPANRGFSFMISQAKNCGVEVIRVIQAYQVNNPEYGYTDDEAQDTYRKWMRRLKELKNSNTSVSCLISPEGHRSEDGILGAGESGVIAAGRVLAPVFYLPIGISYPEKFSRNDFNLGKKVNLTIGKAIIQEDPKKFPSLKEVMKNLAEALPPHMQGSWT